MPMRAAPSTPCGSTRRRTASRHARPASSQASSGWPARRSGFSQLVLADGAAHGASGPRPTDPAGETAIARDLAASELADAVEDGPIPWRPVGNDEWQAVERPRIAFEERLDGLDRPIEQSRRPLHALEPGSPRGVVREAFDRREDRDRDDTMCARGDVDRSPRRGDRGDVKSAAEHRRSGRPSDGVGPE